MPDQEPGTELSDPAQIAGYVAALSTDLATLARKSGLTTLEYLLEMVRLEAENLNRKQPSGESEASR
jgi:hypothetical protein